MTTPSAQNGQKVSTRGTADEFMRLSMKMPLVTAERRMHLGDLMAARNAVASKPNWTVLFAKAFALVAARHPFLRTAHVGFPYAHRYIHSKSIAMIIVERQYADELFPLPCPFKNIERLPLSELHRFMQHFRTAPLEQIKMFRLIDSVDYKTPFLRQLLWWLGYNWSGKRRARYFGTFGVTSVGAEGAGMSSVISPLSYTLHFGLFDDAGRIDVRVTFDHRIADGAPVARALAEIENVLLTDILDELRQKPVARAA